MATYIKTLKEDNGDITYPQTVGGAVLLSGGGDIESALTAKADQTAVDNKISMGDVQGSDLSANAKLAILDMVYPVGSIFMSATLSTPAQVATAMGGTWEAWGSGRVPVGVNASDSSFNTVEKTGGEKTHTLSTAEMPSHTHVQNSHNHTQNPHGHNFRYAANMGGGAYHGPNSSGSEKGWNTWVVNTTATNNATTATNQNTGGGDAHNNLQPYITCYMYKRTA